MIKPYYSEPGITIYHADCRDILPHLPKVDLVLTSPPYDDLRTYCGYQWDFPTVSLCLFNILLPGGVLVWVVGDSCKNGSESGTAFMQALEYKKLGFNLHDTMIYQKHGAPFPESNRYLQCFEYMFVFSKGAPRVFNPLQEKTKYGYGKTKRGSSSTTRSADGSVSSHKYEVGKELRNRFNVWLYQVGYMKSSKEIIAFDHPATFPEALAHDHIYSWSNPGDIVLDPMMGSGTTIKAAKQLGRKAIGIEIEKKYCDIAISRLQQQVFNFNAGNDEKQTERIQGSLLEEVGQQE